MAHTIDTPRRGPAPPRRVLIVSEIPTPYRLPLFRRLADEPSLDVEIAFCATSEPDRPWSLDAQLEGVPYRVLRGVSPRFRTRLDTFVYQINPGIAPLLVRSRPDLLVISGYSVFAEQVALLLAPLLRIPYLVHSETHLLKPRQPWIARVKRATLPLVFARAAGGLAAGSAAADYLAAHGIPRERIRILPNTVDLEEYGAAARQARAGADEVRRRLGLPDRYVFFAGRLTETKGIRTLLAAHERLGGRAPHLVVAGTGPLAPLLENRDRVHAIGFRPQPELVELLALAEYCVVPSRAETWGVVVNEALACGCPVIVSDGVGAAPDLVRDGIDGRVVPAGDVDALAAALLAPRPAGDVAQGPIAGWSYEWGVEQFLEAVELALGPRPG